MTAPPAASAGAPPALPETAEARLEDLLGLLVESSFVLTDPRGAVTAWGRHAEALFRLPAEEASGRGLLEAVGAPPGELLDGGERLRSRRMRIELEGPREERAVPCALVVVPIRLSDGLEFNVFVRDLDAPLPPAAKLERLRRDHGRVLALLEETLGEGLELRADERLAGAIVAYRPLAPVSWLDAARPEEDERAETEGRPDAAAGLIANATRAHERLEETRGLAEAALQALAKLGREVSALRDRVEELAEVRSGSAPSEDLDAVRAEAAAARAEAEEARRVAERSRLELSEASERLAGGARRTSEGTRPAPPRREPRPGFDDAAGGMAVLGLDGRFRELNPSFSRLIGFPEEKFRAAEWPSFVDRENRAEHGELRRALAAGELEEARIQTCYVGGSGLLVPLAGRVSLARDDAGEPLHLVLTLD